MYKTKEFPSGRVSVWRHNKLVAGVWMVEIKLSFEYNLILILFILTIAEIQF